MRNPDQRLKGESHTQPQAESSVTQDYEVVPNPEGGWDVIADGGMRASSHHFTQESAYSEAYRLAENASGEVRMHGRNGEIHESDTIAKPDPFPPRG